MGFVGFGVRPVGGVEIVGYRHAGAAVVAGGRFAGISRPLRLAGLAGDDRDGVRRRRAGHRAEDVIEERERVRVLPQERNRVAVVVRHRQQPDVASAFRRELLAGERSLASRRTRPSRRRSSFAATIGRDWEGDSVSGSVMRNGVTQALADRVVLAKAVRLRFGRREIVGAGIRAEVVVERVILLIDDETCLIRDRSAAADRSAPARAEVADKHSSAAMANGRTNIVPFYASANELNMKHLLWA